MSRTYRLPYSDDVSVGIEFVGPGKTKQEYVNECNINLMMQRYLRVGVFPPNLKVGRYGDFSDVGDFQHSLEVMRAAQAQFAGLPARVRDRFKNDPVMFLEFVHNKDNLEECMKLGLLTEEAASRVKASIEAKAKPEPDKK